MALLSELLVECEFWSRLETRLEGRNPSDLAIVIKPDLSGFEVPLPDSVTPLLVETLIDLFHARQYTNVRIVASASSSSLWAENRDVYALCDLAGYRYKTPSNEDYSIVDLSDDVLPGLFPLTSSLRASDLGEAWYNADVRVVCARGKIDARQGYSLCLESLIEVLPLADKDLHYHRRRDAGEVALSLLDVAPVDLALIEALGPDDVEGVEGQSSGNSATLIASPHIGIADYVAALKMALDPFVSPTFASYARLRPLPASFEIIGDLSPALKASRQSPYLASSIRFSGQSAEFDKLVEPWLQRIDLENFPLKNPLDARMNALLSGFFADTATSPTSRLLLIVANIIVGLLGRGLEAYKTMFDKDRIPRRCVSLNLEPTAYVEADFEQLSAELDLIEQAARTAPEVTDGLRWRTIDRCVVFSYERALPIGFDTFVGAVNIAHFIQYMNDYIGGVVVPLAFDRDGRSVRQLERNLYLPQPNYIALAGGMPIDVTKIETVEYLADCHRLRWKTVRSDNLSAFADDGMAVIERANDGVIVRVVGRQRFALPLFWQVFDVDLIPELKSHLITDAYRTFFERTIVNLEALVEGRDIRIGQSPDEPLQLQSDRLLQALQQYAEPLTPVVLSFVENWTRRTQDGERFVDGEGFTHVRPALAGEEDSGLEPTPATARLVTEFLSELSSAIRKDLARTKQT